MIEDDLKVLIGQFLLSERLSATSREITMLMFLYG